MGHTNSSVSRLLEGLEAVQEHCWGNWLQEVTQDNWKEAKASPTRKLLSTPPQIIDERATSYVCFLWQEWIHGREAA